MKKVIILTLLSLVLVSCWTEIDDNSEVLKNDFLIETKTIAEFENDIFIEKSWKISSSQDIDLSSQASWRVNSILVKEWDIVYKWQTIAKLEDNISNYWLALQRAQNSLDKAKINYETTERQLNKQISDLKINLENLKIDEESSKSSLELEKIENSIKKLAIDYDNLKISNSQSVSSFKVSLSKDLINFTTYIDDVIDFSDRILWVTDKNEDKNDLFEDYLGADDYLQKKETVKKFNELLDYRNNELVKVSFDFDWDTWFASNMNIISNWYLKIWNLLTSLDLTFDNSISSIWSLSDSDIASYKWNISSFWVSYNTYNWSFISLKNSINSFLDTFRNSEESLLKQIELLESDRKIYVKWLDVQLEIDESTLEEAIANKNLSLRQLDTVIKDAEIAYREALKNLDKLSIESPINWIVWEIFVDEWQEVSPWTTMFNISNNSSNEITISFSKDELEYVNVWDNALLEIDNKVYTWSIYSISSVADSNLKYISRISFQDGLNIIWDIVKVKIPLVVDKNLLPINILRVNNDWKWVLNILENWELSKIEVELWESFYDKIEIISEINPDLEIITSNLENFDKEKFNLKIK